MSDRSEYCKKLLRKALIIYTNVSEEEKKDIEDHIDAQKDVEPLTDDATPCNCEKRSDVLSLNGRKYCCDCLHYLGDKKDETKL